MFISADLARAQH